MKFKKGFMLAIFSGVLVVSGCAQDNQQEEDTSTTKSQNEESSSDQEGNSQDKSKEDSQGKELTEERAKELISELERRIVDIRTTDDGKVMKFDSKEELITHVSEIAKQDLANKLVSDLFENRDEGLYIIPKDYPPFLIPSKNYSFEQVEEGKYQLIQKNSTEIHGEYKLTITYELIEDSYKITDYKLDPQK